MISSKAERIQKRLKQSDGSIGSTGTSSFGLGRLPIHRCGASALVRVRSVSFVDFDVELEVGLPHAGTSRANLFHVPQHAREGAPKRVHETRSVLFRAHLFIRLERPRRCAFPALSCISIHGPHSQHAREGACAAEPCRVRPSTVKLQAYDSYFLELRSCSAEPHLPLEQ